ncbi:uncharacterized protein MONOS_18446 [Monocercomonoides exilis]|uniref:uncharacterized protein n=1 Tax=Monocercomonoides exilis TaxID=2049356 RepID=UPI003559EF5D|nr:hypothetical protein MONOS_18446 [Monocercomonoides exilis]
MPCGWKLVYRLRFYIILLYKGVNFKEIVIFYFQVEDLEGLVVPPLKDLAGTFGINRFIRWTICLAIVKINENIGKGVMPEKDGLDESELSEGCASQSVLFARFTEA